MSQRSYFILWSVYVLAFASVWLFGAMSLLSLVVFGFVANALVFVGMICSLPGWVSHPASSRNETESERLSGHHAMSPARSEKGFAVIKSA